MTEPTASDTGLYLGALRREGDLLAAAAERAPFEAAVPACPGWNVRELVRHIGGIHRWATSHVEKTRSGPWDPFVEFADTWPADADLLDWFREGHAALVSALECASPDLECFTFLPAPSALAFWARRQAHETGIHRADAESATGPITAYDPAVASDGIEELLFGFASRSRSKLLSDAPRSLALSAVDAEQDWLVSIGSEPPRVTRERSRADCVVRGTASDLFLLLWNRRSPAGLDVSGDARVLELWREKMQVRWS